MSNGYTTADLPTAPLADELIVNRNGNTALQRVADLSTQLAGSGPLAEQLDDLRLLASGEPRQLLAADMATTAAIALTGAQTIDGVATGTGKRVLVKDQTDAAQNGVWVTSAGAWTRATDLDAAADFAHASIYVIAGTVNLGTTWMQIASVATVGTSAVTWRKIKDEAGLQALLNGSYQINATTAVDLITTSLPYRRNIFDIAAAAAGVYVDTAGGISSNASYTASGYIPVRVGKDYRFSVNVPHLAWYGLDKSFISYAANVLADTVIVPPAGAAFLRFSCLTGTMQKAMMVQGLLPAQYLAFGCEDPATAKRNRIATALDMCRGVLPAVLNLFDRTRAHANTALNSAGNSYSAENYITSDYIAVLPGDSVVCNFASNSLWWYTEDKVALSQVTAVVGGTALTAPAGAYYVRVHVGSLDPNYLTPMFLRQSTLPASYVGFGFEDPGQASVNRTLSARLVVDEAFPADRNIFNKGRIQTDKAISAANGAIYTAAGWFVTPNMPVTAGDYFTANYGSNSTVFRDINGKFVSSITSQAANTPVAVPAGAHYVQFQIYGVSKADDLHVVRGATPPSGYRAFGGRDGWLPHQGQNLTILGDSISYTGYYIPTVVSGTGMTLAATHAQPGRAMAKAIYARADLGATPTALTAADFADVDVVAIALGTNDFGGSRSLGTIADASTGYSGGNSFYHDVFAAVDTLLTWHPTLTVVLATPMQRFDLATNGLGLTLRHYRAAIMEVAEVMGCVVADCYAEGGINARNASTMLAADNLHPLQIGSYAQGRVIAQAINRA